MASYVLVHGAFHGGWCWERIAEPLRSEGHEVFTPDLPPHGFDGTRLRDIRNEHLADRVIEALELCSEPAILVGHSMGGIPISAAAEMRPDLVRELVFLAAVMLPNGASVLTEFGQHAPDSLGLGEGALIADEQEGSLRLGAGIARKMFFNTCGEEEVRWVEDRLDDTIALGPLVDPVVVTSERFGAVPRSYVMTLRDQSVTPQFQRWMIETSGCDHVYELDTDHSPWLSDPTSLLGVLRDVSASPAA